MDNTLLLARIKDTVDLVYRTDKPKYLGFLSVEEAAFVKKYLESRNIKHSFFGGDDSCERTYLGCFPEWLTEPSFPIKAVTFKYRKIDSLRHRDILGALMSLGLKRETVGDIFIEEGRAVVFLSDEIAEYVLNNISKIGNVGVSSNFLKIEELPQKEELIDYTATVSSLRLDCVVSVLANCSRNNANSMIESGFVSINSVVSEKNTKIISDGDVISIRRKGKFKIVSSNNKTKKDRIVLVYKSY